MPPLAELELVRVATYGAAVRRTAKESEKWDPVTRETADHSIPFLVAAAFQDGAVTPATFAPARIQDPALRPLIKKLTVTEEPEFTPAIRGSRAHGSRSRPPTAGACRLRRATRRAIARTR
jgi:2-methylcitrate dehydratase